MDSQRDLIRAVEEGYIRFWTRPDKPWRNKIYEANIFATEVKNQYKKQAVESVPGQEENIPVKSGRLRDMSLQSDNLIRFAP